MPLAAIENVQSKLWLSFGFSAAAVVVYFSVNPAYALKQAVAQLPFSDPLIHVCSFALVTFCFYLSTQQKLLQLSTACGLMVLALALEMLQTVLFPIELEMVDIYANMAGVVVGYVVAGRVSVIFNRWRRSGQTG